MNAHNRTEHPNRRRPIRAGVKRDVKIYRKTGAANIIFAAAVMALLTPPLFPQNEKKTGDPKVSASEETNTVSGLQESLKKKLQRSEYNFKMGDKGTIYRNDHMRYLWPKEKTVWEPAYPNFVFQQAVDYFHNGIVLFYRSIARYDKIRTRFNRRTPYSLFSERMFGFAHRDLSRAKGILDFMRKFEVMDLKRDKPFRQLYLATYKTLAIWEMYREHPHTAISHCDIIIDEEPEDIDALKIRFICANQIFYRLHRIDVKEENPHFPMAEYLRVRKIKNESLKRIADLNYPKGDLRGDNLRKNFIEWNIKRTDYLIKQYRQKVQDFKKSKYQNFDEKLKKRMDLLKQPPGETKKKTEASGNEKKIDDGNKKRFKKEVTIETKSAKKTDTIKTDPLERTKTKIGD